MKNSDRSSLAAVFYFIRSILRLLIMPYRFQRRNLDRLRSWIISRNDTNQDRKQQSKQAKPPRNQRKRRALQAKPDHQLLPKEAAGAPIFENELSTIETI